MLHFAYCILVFVLSFLYLQRPSTSSIRSSHDADGLDAASMRAEEFTAAKEKRLRGMGVEILTVDPTYRPDAGITGECSVTCDVLPPALQSTNV